MVLPALHAQRIYTNTSVLSSGAWYKISVTGPGIYKMDIALLNKLGINTTNLSSASIRLFGNGGAMLPEACNGFKNDDLVENALEVNDGGDGLFNGNDYFLFYAPGPDTWLKDSANQRFIHKKNLYSNKSFYFITIGGIGKRVETQAAGLVSNTSVNSFTARYFHELDTINFLNGSKDWYGEEFSATAGLTSQTFSTPFSNVNTSQPATIVSACVARSVNGSSRFTASINGQTVLQQDIAAVGNTNLDVFAKSDQSVNTFTPNNTISVGYNFTPGGSGAQGWLDWFEIFCRQNLLLTGSEQLLFRDWKSVAPGNVASFSIQNAASVQVWDVTDIASPVKMNTVLNGNNISFINSAASLHEYIAFSSSFLSPETIGKVDNQNLHNSQPGRFSHCHLSHTPAAGTAYCQLSPER